MGPTTRQFSIGLATAALGIGAYHLAVRPVPAAATSSLDDRAADEVTALRKEFAALRGDVERRLITAPQAAAALGSRLTALDLRLSMDERRAAAGTFVATNDLSSEALTQQGVSEDQVQALRTMLEELRRRDQDRGRTEKLISLVRAAGAQVSADDEGKAAAAMSAFHAAVEALYVGGSLGATVEERAANSEKARGLRARLEADLKVVLPEAAVARLLASIPTFDTELPAPIR